MFAGEASLEGLSGAVSGLGDVLFSAGVVIESTKLQILVTLGEALLEIQYALLMADWTFGGSLSWIPVIEAVTVAVVRQIAVAAARRLAAALAEAVSVVGVKALARRVGVEVAQETGFALAQELVVEGIMAAEGHGGLSVRQIFTAGGQGAGGGAGGGVAHGPLRHLVGDPSSKGGHVLKGVFTDYGVGVVGGVTGSGGQDLSAVSVLGGAGTGVVTGAIPGAGGHTPPPVSVGDVEVNAAAAPGVGPDGGPGGDPVVPGVGGGDPVAVPPPGTGSGSDSAADSDSGTDSDAESVVDSLFDADGVSVADSVSEFGDPDPDPIPVGAGPVLVATGGGPTAGKGPDIRSGSDSGSDPGNGIGAGRGVGADPGGGVAGDTGSPAVGGGAVSGVPGAETPAGAGSTTPPATDVGSGSGSSGSRAGSGGASGSGSARVSGGSGPVVSGGDRVAGPGGPAVGTGNAVGVISEPTLSGSAPPSVGSGAGAVSGSAAGGGVPDAGRAAIAAPPTAPSSSTGAVPPSSSTGAVPASSSSATSTRASGSPMQASSPSGVAGAVSGSVRGGDPVGGGAGGGVGGGSGSGRVTAGGVSEAAGAAASAPAASVVPSSTTGPGGPSTPPSASGSSAGASIRSGSSSESVGGTTRSGSSGASIRSGSSGESVGGTTGSGSSGESATRTTRSGSPGASDGEAVEGGSSAKAGTARTVGRGEGGVVAGLAGGPVAGGVSSQAGGVVGGSQAGGVVGGSGAGGGGVGRRGVGGGDRFAEGTVWHRDAGGWLRAGRGGRIDLGPGSGDRFAELPAGARGVFDGNGVLQHVVLGDGSSRDRGLDGTWSRARQHPGEVQVVKTARGDVVGPDNEKVVDTETAEVIAYRRIRDDDGKRLAQPAVLLPDGSGGWKETAAPVDPVRYEAWLAGANQAHDTARTLFDIAGRSDARLPESARLTQLSDDGLKELLGGTSDDMKAALYEAVRRTKGVALRWTQLSAGGALERGDVVNMAAGEGKSYLFLMSNALEAAVLAKAGQGGAVHMHTTRDVLAEQLEPDFRAVLGPLGFAVHRLNSDDPPPPPKPGQPTVYLGTSQDAAFTLLKHGSVGGRGAQGLGFHAEIDEIDEALVYSNGHYILSEGTAGDAAPVVADPIRGMRTFLSDKLGSGELTEADFGREPDTVGGPARLTEAGIVKATALLDPRGELAPAQVEARLDALGMAAAAHWEYVEDVHYVIDDETGKLYIIDQATHQVLYDPRTSSESRWNGGLAQALEAKHGLAVRHDSDGDKKVTARGLYQKYGKVVGASGTANGKNEVFAEQGLSSKIADVPRYYASGLATEEMGVSANLKEKLTAIADDVARMQGLGDTARPQLVLTHRNDLVKQLSAQLDERNVAHVSIDAKWFLKQGADRDEAFKEVVARAGTPGAVLVINMQGARGVDIPLDDAAKALGGLHVVVTGHSEVSADIDVQAENRAARSGDRGSVKFYVSPDDDLFRLSHNPQVQLAVIQYRTAVQTGTEVSRAQSRQGLRDAVPVSQDDAAARMGIRTGPPPRAPPSHATSTDTLDRGDRPVPERRPPPTTNQNPDAISGNDDGPVTSGTGPQRDAGGPVSGQSHPADPGHGVDGGEGLMGTNSSRASARAVGGVDAGEHLVGEGTLHLGAVHQHSDVDGGDVRVEQQRSAAEVPGAATAGHVDDEGLPSPSGGEGSVGEVEFDDQVLTQDPHVRAAAVAARREEAARLLRTRLRRNRFQEADRGVDPVEVPAYWGGTGPAGPVADWTVAQRGEVVAVLEELAPWLAGRFGGDAVDADADADADAEEFGLVDGGPTVADRALGVLRARAVRAWRAVFPGGDDVHARKLLAAVRSKLPQALQGVSNGSLRIAFGLLPDPPVREQDITTAHHDMMANLLMAGRLHVETLGSGRKEAKVGQGSGSRRVAGYQRLSEGGDVEEGGSAGAGVSYGFAERVRALTTDQLGEVSQLAKTLSDLVRAGHRVRVSIEGGGSRNGSSSGSVRAEAVRDALAGAVGDALKGVSAKRVRDRIVYEVRDRGVGSSASPYAGSVRGPGARREVRVWWSVDPVPKALTERRSRFMRLATPGWARRLVRPAVSTVELDGSSWGFLAHGRLPDGGLAPEAVKEFTEATRALDRPLLQEAMHTSGEQAVSLSGVSEEEVRERFRRAPERYGRGFPELFTYTAHGGGPSEAERTVRWESGVKVTFVSVGADGSAYVRRELVSKALGWLRVAGYVLPSTLTVILVPYGRRLRIADTVDETGQAALDVTAEPLNTRFGAALAAYFAVPQTLVILPLVVSPAPFGEQERGFSVALDTTDPASSDSGSVTKNPGLGVVMSQMLQWMHFHRSGGAYVDLLFAELADDVKPVARRVSVKAATSPIAFIVEYELALLQGRTFAGDGGAEVHELYTALTGLETPTPASMPTVSATVTASGTDIGTDIGAGASTGTDRPRIGSGETGSAVAGSRDAVGAGSDDVPLSESPGEAILEQETYREAGLGSVEKLLDGTGVDDVPGEVRAAPTKLTGEERLGEAGNTPELRDMLHHQVLNHDPVVRTSGVSGARTNRGTGQAAGSDTSSLEAGHGAPGEVDGHRSDSADAGPSRVVGNDSVVEQGAGARGPWVEPGGQTARSASSGGRGKAPMSEREQEQQARQQLEALRRHHRDLSESVADGDNRKATQEELDRAEHALALHEEQVEADWGPADPLRAAAASAAGDDSIRDAVQSVSPPNAGVPAAATAGSPAHQPGLVGATTDHPDPTVLDDVVGGGGALVGSSSPFDAWNGLEAGRAEHVMDLVTTSLGPEFGSTEAVKKNVKAAFGSLTEVERKEHAVSLAATLERVIRFGESKIRGRGGARPVSAGSEAGSSSAGVSSSGQLTPERAGTPAAASGSQVGGLSTTDHLDDGQGEQDPMDLWDGLAGNLPDGLDAMFSGEPTDPAELGTTSPHPPTFTDDRPTSQLDPSVDAGQVVTPGGIPPQFRTDSNALFRFDERPPHGRDGVFETGLPSYSHDLDLVTHVTQRESGLVSTTRHERLDNFVEDGGTTYRYRIDAPGGVDVNATLTGVDANTLPIVDAILSRYTHEHEVAFPGGIRRENIISAARQTRGDYVFDVRDEDEIENPHYDPGARNVRMEDEKWKSRSGGGPVSDRTDLPKSMADLADVAARVSAGLDRDSDRGGDGSDVVALTVFGWLSGDQTLDGVAPLSSRMTLADWASQLNLFEIHQGVDDIEGVIKKHGPGSHNVVMYCTQDAPIAMGSTPTRAFNVFYDGDTVRVIDGLTGRVSAWPPNHDEFGGQGTYAMLGPTPATRGSGGDSPSLPTESSAWDDDNASPPPANPGAGADQHDDPVLPGEGAGYPPIPYPPATPEAASVDERADTDIDDHGDPVDTAREADTHRPPRAGEDAVEGQPSGDAPEVAGGRRQSRRSRPPHPRPPRSRGCRRPGTQTAPRTPRPNPRRPMRAMLRRGAPMSGTRVLGRSRHRYRR
ncbi:hypothetical protein MARA_01530 (plasmid) [Mycolicibacterium arabiense]|uniref:SecA family profile domain-containing protein n=2 Tax=Mycolicibacterium arabiense TaxID=1286181 RepID=A0A7I7RQB3_9MYCO|nr:hypothetical protein MARA_01530 [Mycolicibacterium arabiense]